MSYLGPSEIHSSGQQDHRNRLGISLKKCPQVSDYQEKITDKVLDLITEMSAILPRFELYQKLGSEAQLQTALLDVFTDVVRFCVLVLKHIRHKFAC